MIKSFTVYRFRMIDGVMTVRPLTDAEANRSMLQELWRYINGIVSDDDD